MLLVLAFALYFLLQALIYFLSLTKVQDPTRTVILLAYCLAVGFYIIYVGVGPLRTLHG